MNFLMQSVRQFLLENRDRIHPDRFSAMEERRCQVDAQEYITEKEAQIIFGDDFYSDFVDNCKNGLPEVLRELLED